MRLNATVRVDGDGKLVLKPGPQPEVTLSWLGGHTFGSGSARYTFVLDAATDTFYTLQIDQVSGLYVLTRARR